MASAFPFRHTSATFPAETTIAGTLPMQRAGDFFEQLSGYALNASTPSCARRRAGCVSLTM
ncbi:hypothetical protein, partial [Burkholderia cenocepacia]|uniref:hypothetical protein n=1 Tax=Burkholderia cenocepacia TaxID=95486 RepID=UPI001E3AEE17